jgi:hypothetical protein
VENLLKVFDQKKGYDRNNIRWLQLKASVYTLDGRDKEARDIYLDEKYNWETCLERLSFSHI